MKKIIALALVAASLTAFPVATPAFAVDTGISALCGPDGPEAYKRPGGYCEQIGSNSSLVERQEEDCFPFLNLISFEMKPTDEPLLVADACGYAAPLAPAVAEPVAGT